MSGEYVPSIWVLLSREYHMAPNIGHGTGKARDCYECQRIAKIATTIAGEANVNGANDDR